MQQSLIIVDLGNGYVHMWPAEGYRLYSKKLRRVVSDATVKESKIGEFEAIPV